MLSRGVGSADGRRRGVSILLGGSSVLHRGPDANLRGDIVLRRAGVLLGRSLLGRSDVLRLVLRSSNGVLARRSHVLLARSSHVLDLQSLVISSRPDWSLT